jgi:hypothetical protein
MNTQDEDRDVSRSQYFDPFPQPQTIPAGWDLSGLFPAPQSDSTTNEIDSTDSDSKA